MANVELVIKISEKTYNALTHTEFDANLVVNEMRKSIANGKPLSKGHGDLVDKKDLSLMTVHLIDGTFVCDAETIIEADNESEE